jgi:small-conductance mechanosensitive channel
VTAFQVSQNALLVLQVVALVVALRLTYWLIFKARAWHSPLVRALTVQLRPWVYVLIPVITVTWIFHQLQRSAQPPPGLQEYLIPIADTTILVLCSILVVEACSTLLFDYLFAIRRKADVPPILRSLARTIVYIGVGLFLLPRVLMWNDIVGLLTSSAIVSIILGLALQETLGNLFAGIAMQIARPYLTGHWIKMGSYEGVVERADWRSMTVRTLRGDQVSFPHSLVAKMEIHNYSFPSLLHACTVEVGAHYRHPPATVKALLVRCAQETPGVLATPLPVALLRAYQDFAILYAVTFWIDDFSQHTRIESEVLTHIWYQFKRAKIQIPYPIQEVHPRNEQPVTNSLEDTLSLLRKIGFLQILSDAQRRELAQRLETSLFTARETICRQGELGEQFYIIKSGRVEVTAHNEHGQSTVVRTMGPGDFFGEISLLTGEPRSATVTALEDAEMLVINKEDMRCMLEQNRELAAYVSDVLARRQDYLVQQWTQPEGSARPSDGSQEKHVASLRQEILEKIVAFFSY